MSKGPSTNLQTLIIGIDAGCLNVLEPLFEKGVVPNVKRLFDEGVSGTLSSSIPPWTSVMWPSLYTGVNPGKHGVFGFLKYDGYEWSVINATNVRSPALWELLDARGFKSVVVNVPVTHPAPEIDGAVLPGYVAPKRPDCHPDGLLEEIEAEFGPYHIYNPRIAKSDSPKQKVEKFVNLTRMRGDAFVYLCEQHDPDFGFVQFQQTDTIFHEFPGDRDRAQTIYEEVDRQVGRILDSCAPETVFVVSDHGMDAYERRFRMNNYLREHGYVEVKRGGSGMPNWATVHDGGSSADTDLVDVLLSGAARLGFTSQRAASILEKLRLADVFEEIVPDKIIRAASEQVDFANSTAFMRSHVECGIRINLEGREPDGVVPAEKYEAVRKQLIELLAAAETETGDPVFEDVAPREEYFHGPYVEDAVDIVTVPNDFRYYLTTWLLGERFEMPDGPAWDHTLDGVIAAWGAGVDTAQSLEDAHIFDVAPTVLASMRLPAHDDMDGRVLPIVEEIGVDTYREVHERAVVESQTEGVVEQQLSDLGYLEG